MRKQVLGCKRKALEKLIEATGMCVSARAHTHTLSLSHTHTHTHSLSLSNTRTHARTHIETEMKEIETVNGELDLIVEYLKQIEKRKESLAKV